MFRQCNPAIDTKKSIPCYCQFSVHGSGTEFFFLSGIQSDDVSGLLKVLSGTIHFVQLSLNLSKHGEWVRETMRSPLCKPLKIRTSSKRFTHSKWESQILHLHMGTWSYQMKVFAKHLTLFHPEEKHSVTFSKEWIWNSHFWCQVHGTERYSSQAIKW